MTSKEAPQAKPSSNVPQHTPQSMQENLEIPDNQSTSTPLSQNISLNPRLLTNRQILQLQHVAGNQATRRLLAVRKQTLPEQPRSKADKYGGGLIQRKLTEDDLKVVQYTVYQWAQHMAFSTSIADKAVQILERKYNNSKDATTADAIQDAIQGAIENAMNSREVNKNLVIRSLGESFEAVYENKHIGELDLHFDDVYWLGFIQVNKEYQGLGVGKRLIQAAVQKIGHLFISTQGQIEHEQHDADDTRWLTEDGAALVNSAKKSGILKAEWFQNPFDMGKIPVGNIQQAEQTEFGNKDDDMPNSEDQPKDWPSIPENFTGIAGFYKIDSENKCKFFGIQIYIMLEEPITYEFDVPKDVNDPNEIIQIIVKQYSISDKAIKVTEMRD